MSFTSKIHAFIVRIVKVMEIHKNPGGNLYLPVYFWETEFGQGGGTRVSQTSPTDPRSGFLCRVVAKIYSLETLCMRGGECGSQVL